MSGELAPSVKHRSNYLFEFMDNLEITPHIRKVIREAEKENALTIAAIELVEKALWKEFHMVARFGDEQTFRVMPNEDAANPFAPLDVDAVAKALMDNANDFGALPLGKKIRNAKPIIDNFHLDNEPQKYEAVTNIGSAKQVARWIIMFRELAMLKAKDDPSVEGVSFRGSQHIQYKSPFHDAPRDFLNTNGFHSNFSLLFEDKNIFQDQNVLLHAAHGVKQLSEETTLLTAMFPDDYERYKIPKTHKANFVGVTDRKGDISLRVADAGWLYPEHKRIEDRMPSSSTNPYDAHLKILLGIYMGLKDKVKVVENGKDPALEVAPADYGYLNDDYAPKNIFKQLLQYSFAKPKEAAKLPPPLHPIPKSIDAAIEEFKQGTLLRKTLNILNDTYGDGSLIGDEMHQQVLQRVAKNIKQQKREMGI